MTMLTDLGTYWAQPAAVSREQSKPAGEQRRCLTRVSAGEKPSLLLRPGGRNRVRTCGFSLVRRNKIRIVLSLRGSSCTLTAKTMSGDVLRCLGKCGRWFPEVVPGAASGIAYRKCSAAAPVVLE